MDNDLSLLRKDEQVLLKVGKLYESFGFKKYKMCKFEEYGLYIENKSFLSSDHIITFTDLDGKLLALKPDVTLSIVKNAKAYNGKFEKLYYVESVYREGKNVKKYKEITQTGLEVLGKIDAYATLETVFLATKTLEAIEDSYILDISHVGFVTGLVDALELSDYAQKQKILDCIVSKNLHDLRKELSVAGIDEVMAARVEKLITVSGKFGEALKEAKQIVVNKRMSEAVEELESVYNALKGTPTEQKIRLDFSILNDTNYYCGIIFQGYVSKVANMVLSGGRYDKLLEKLGRGVGAIGFALWLDELNGCYPLTVEYDVDTVILYDDKADTKALFDAVRKLTAEGISVKVEKSEPSDIKYKRLYRFADGALEVQNV